MLPKMRAKIAVVALVLVLLVPGISHALTDKQKALIGLKGLKVVVEAPPEAERLRLTKNQIKTDVELRLRKAGIRVLTEEQWLKTPGAPYLYVKVTAVIRPNIPIYAYNIIYPYNIIVALCEQVMLFRGISVEGTIWISTITRLVEKNKIRLIRESVGDLVDKFINDYMAANPKH
jgi:hypothetical protein